MTDARDADRQGENLSGRTVRAGGWAIAGRVVAKFIDLFTFITLAQLLTPRDMGLVAMALTAILITETILELPVSTALIRIEKPSLSLFETAFTLGLLRGVVIALILGALAVPLARFYGEEQLALIVLVLGLAPIMRGLVSPRMILFAQKLDFRWDFLLDVSSKALSFVVAVAAALYLRSYWAVVLATVTGPFVAVALSYRLAPLRPRLSLKGWPVFAGIIGWNSLAQAIAAINWQIDRLLLPRFIGASAFGRYAIASDLSAAPQLAFGQPLIRPLLAALSTLSPGPALTEVFRQSAASYVMLMGPIFLFLGFVAEPLTEIVLDERWRGVAPILSWLCFAHVISLPANLIYPLAIRLNQARFLAIRCFTEFVIKLPLMLAGILFFGVEGALAAYTLTCGAVFLIAAYSVGSMLDMRFGAYLKIYIRPALALAASFAVFAALRALFAPAVEDGSAYWLTSGLIVAAAAATYFAVLFAAWLVAGRPAGPETFVIAKLRAGAARIASA